MTRALLASLLGHVLAVIVVLALVSGRSDPLSRDAVAQHRRAGENEIVAIATTIRFDRRVRVGPPSRRGNDSPRNAPSFADLRRGEGRYVPVKAWHAKGLNYYYVSYAFRYADGTFERGSVPWPVHFASRDDPFAHPELARSPHMSLPGPPPGYMPPGNLGRILRAYFPALRF